MKKKFCPSCGGRGEWDIQIREGNRIRLAKQRCEHCNGTGYIPDTDDDRENDDNDEKYVVDYLLK